MRERRRDLGAARGVWARKEERWREGKRVVDVAVAMGQCGWGECGGRGLERRVLEKEGDL